MAGQSGGIELGTPFCPVSRGLTMNRITKAVLAITSGGRHFAIQVLPGLAVVILSDWITAGFLYS
jgi:hypothetical protein